MGPSLLGVFDRSSGQAPAFNYSAALQAAKLKWDDANLDKWLTKPAELVPGNMMMYPGKLTLRAVKTSLPTSRH